MKTRGWILTVICSMLLLVAGIIITNHDTWFPCQFAFRYAEDTQYLDSPLHAVPE